MPRTEMCGTLFAPANKRTGSPGCDRRVYPALILDWLVVNRLAQFCATWLANKPRSRRRRDGRSSDADDRSTSISGGSHVWSNSAHSKTCLASASSAQRTNVGFRLVTANSPTLLQYSTVARISPGTEG